MAAQLVALFLFHQQKMLTGILGIIHLRAGGVSLESQGRGYEVSDPSTSSSAAVRLFARKRLPQK